MNEATIQHLFFSYFLGIGPITFDRLISHFGSIARLYQAKNDEIVPFLKGSLKQEFIAFRKRFDPEKEYLRLQKKGIQVICRSDKMYPSQFHNLVDPPICIYAKGNLANYDYERDNYFAIVGTRTPTDYGKQVTTKFSSELAQAGFIIVSGLAKGIDAYAHKGALSVGGRTIAFLGCGVDVIYPSQNAQLYKDILAHDGLIISEAPPDMLVQKGLFVSRNRLISGLSKGVLVTEGLKDSGSLITARCALEQGKDVFAPPAPITSEQSAAPNLLLKEGAKMVISITDILEEFNMQYSSISKESIMASLSPEEQKVYLLLSQQPQTSDELALLLGIPIHLVLTSISGMELKGVIAKGSGSKYFLY
ncbi:DNA-processing protein DprA [soil metagenome]